MAEKEKTLTPEEAMKKRKEHARKTLENKVFQEIVGSSEVMSNQSFYGHNMVQGAKPAYDDAINSEEILKIRKKLYSEKVKEAEEKGIHTYARPSINDYDVEIDVRTQIEENKPVLSIGELEDIVKNIAGDFGVKVPDVLRDYVPLDILITKDGKKRDEKELSETEKEARVFYSQLSQIYNRANAYKASEKSRYADLVEPLVQIAEKYKKPEGKE